GLAEPANHELLQLMERRLYRAITVPAMVLAWLAGLAMLYQQPGLWASGWLQLKLVCVLALSATTFYAGWLLKRFRCRHPQLPTGKALRILNEIPTLLMLVIVAMVIFRPF